MSKSKEIAKLLGIKRKTFSSDVEADLYKKAEKYNSLIYFNQDSCCYYVEIYPDFEKPENFITLLKIDIEISLDSFFFKSDKTPQEQLIDSLICKLKNSSNARKVYSDFAQQQNWEV